MPNSAKKLKTIINSIKQKPSNFIIGLFVLLILVITVILSIPKSDQVSTDLNKKSALTKIKELISGKKVDDDIVEPNIYVVKEGDYLWKISEEAYGSGFNAYDIAKANNLIDANLIEVNQELILPEVETKEPTTISNDLEENETNLPSQYTVLQGDHLWGIAQKVYGDPYKWLSISIANNLVNPSVIEVGQVLTLP